VISLHIIAKLHGALHPLVAWSRLYLNETP
jgi:hypothetical protein